MRSHVWFRASLSFIDGIAVICRLLLMGVFCLWFLVGSQGGFLLIPVARDRKGSRIVSYGGGTNTGDTLKKSEKIRSDSTCDYRESGFVFGPSAELDGLVVLVTRSPAAELTRWIQHSAAGSSG